MILDDLLSSDAFTPVNKALAKKLGFVCAGYLGELIRQRKRFGENEFYFSQSQMEEEIGINGYTQRQCVKQLTNLGIISVERKGALNKYYFLINDDKIIEFFKEDIQCFKNGSTSDLNFKAPVVKNLKHINNNNNKNENKKLLSLQESSKTENLEETSLLSIDIEEEKEKSSAKKEKESFGNVEINEFIEKIKEKCNSLGIMYDKTKEREFSRHILTAREFGENSTKCGMTRTDFSINILIASIKIGYFKGPCNGPMKIYQNYADVYNRTVMKRGSGGGIVHIDV